MKITLEIKELQTLQIEDLQRRTGCSWENLLTALIDRLKQDANSQSYLLAATSRTIHEHTTEQAQIRKLKLELYGNKIKTLKNGKQRN